MSQSEYTTIKDGDWTTVRQGARRFNERLSALEGYSGTNKKYSNTNMNSNQILGGPPNQVVAASDEFITAYYVDSTKKKRQLGPTGPSGNIGATGATGPSGSSSGEYLTDYTVITKSADQDVTNNANDQADTDLNFTVTGSHYYDIVVHFLYAQSSSSCGFRGAFKVSAGSMSGSGWAMPICGTLIATEGGSTTGDNNYSTTYSDINMVVGQFIRFTFVPSTNCTFGWYFANSNPGTGHVSRMCKNSKLYYFDMT